MKRLILAFMFTAGICMAAVSLEPRNNRMVKQMIAHAHQKHAIPKDWLASQFESLSMNESCLNLMQKPFEAKPWMTYKKMMLSKKRINNGKQFISQYKNTFDLYESQYKIPSSVVAAIIGIETSYGTNKGNFHALEALTTLALYYTPRSQFFYDETISLLDYAYHNQLDLGSIKSSYAGAVGIPQFMPSNIKLYGRHHGAKGSLDIYDNHHDAIASVFNYLKKNGKWQPNQPVMKKLTLNAKKQQEILKLMGSQRLFPATPEVEKTFNLRPVKHSWIIKLQTADDQTTLYRVFPNFRSIMRYNNSIHYSSAVFALSQHLA
ncbi:MAG: lytic murein transglycosylase [Pseudomonadota bacterium]|nr:lytic murein transglycosylase [Pseudomonadota bacterium]